MSGSDRIEIEQGGRILRGMGSLRVTLGTPGRGGWSALPTVQGIVTFDERVTLRDLEAMDSADVRVTLSRGSHHVFSEAVMMSATGGPAYVINLDCYGIAS